MDAPSLSTRCIHPSLSRASSRHSPIDDLGRTCRVLMSSPEPASGRLALVGVALDPQGRSVLRGGRGRFSLTLLRHLDGFVLTLVGQPGSPGCRAHTQRRREHAPDASRSPSTSERPDLPWAPGPPTERQDRQPVTPPTRCSDPLPVLLHHSPERPQFPGRGTRAGLVWSSLAMVGAEPRNRRIVCARRREDGYPQRDSTRGCPSLAVHSLSHAALLGQQHVAARPTTCRSTSCEGSLRISV